MKSLLESILNKNNLKKSVENGSSINILKQKLHKTSKFDYNFRYNGSTLFINANTNAIYGDEIDIIIQTLEGLKKIVLGKEIEYIYIEDNPLDLKGITIDSENPFSLTVAAIGNIKNGIFEHTVSTNNLNFDNCTFDKLCIQSVSNIRNLTNCNINVLSCYTCNNNKYKRNNLGNLIDEFDYLSWMRKGIKPSVAELKKFNKVVTYDFTMDDFVPNMHGNKINYMVVEFFTDHDCMYNAIGIILSKQRLNLYTNDFLDNCKSKDGYYVAMLYDTETRKMLYKKNILRIAEYPFKLM